MRRKSEVEEEEEERVHTARAASSVLSGYLCAVLPLAQLFLPPFLQSLAARRCFVYSLDGI